MALTRERKAQIIEDLAGKLKKARMVVLASYQGVSVSDMEELRSEADKKDVEYKVVKNTLLRLALEKAGIRVEESFFQGPLSLAFSYDDDIAPCKVIYEFGKEHKGIEIKGGISEGKFVDPDYITTLAILPSKEELYPRLVSTLFAPLSRFSNALVGNVRGLTSILHQYKESKV